MIVVGPGTPLMCVLAGECLCGCSHVTKDAMYFCEEAYLSPFAQIIHRSACTVPNCAGISLLVSGKDHGFCANRFVPLDPDDTSLVEDEEEEEFITLEDFAKRFINV